MNFNWIDIILIGILAVTLIIGLIKGLVRQAVGLLAVFGGLILALIYYPVVSDLYLRIIDRAMIAEFLGFVTIFFGTLCIGWILGNLLSRMMKGPLKFMNHMLGGGLGLIKGLIISGVLVFALLVFPVDSRALSESRLAPACLQVAKVFVDLIPEELRERFKEAYRDMLGGWRDERKV